MTKLIAEIGWNHMGDMVLAKEMIAAASAAGADYAKFQTWSVDRLKSGSWDEDGRRQIYEKAELSLEDHHQLMEYCESQGIIFFSSVFSPEDAKLLSQVTTRIVKIPSFENSNWELLEFVNESYDEIIISSGTSKYNEIQKAMEILDRNKTTLLHCVSSYPCKPENANLPKISYLSKIASSVGYSDHVVGIEVAKMSLEFGVSYIEKHFTTDHDLPGRDNKFAILPHEMDALCNYIKDREKAMSFKGTDFQELERDSRENYRRRFDG